MIMLVFMSTTRVNSKDNAKSNDSDHIFVIRENMCLKHRCPSDKVIGKQVSAFSKSEKLEFI